MELTGMFMKTLPVVEGTSSRGSWRKQVFAIKTEGVYPKTVAFTLWNDDIDRLERIAPGQKIEVKFDVESKEYNDKFFTDLKAYAINAVGQAPPTPLLQDYPATPQSVYKAPPIDTGSVGDGGDLPF